MSKIWYCPNCGYEVTSRGRCHSCRERLVASALAELPVGKDDDEVGYRLEGWVDRERGRLIERLNIGEIPHRFEDDELVVGAEDESRVDDLIAELAADPEGDWTAEVERGEMSGSGDADSAGEEFDEAVAAAVRLLADAAGRLRRDPTDMHADADVAEASAAVFMTDMYYEADADTWAAVGRVTRRLLSALGADEALEDEIRAQAAVLEKLLAPLVVAPGGDAAEPRTLASAVAEQAATALIVEPTGPSGGPEPAVGSEPGVVDETVYELPEWLPEQRAELGVLLDEAGITYEWDGGDLVVPAAREGEAEALFGRVGGPTGEDDDDGGENRYRALEELFAAADRLAGDPADEQRAADTVAWIREAAGPPPIGMDEVYWFRIMTAARTLSETIGSDGDERVIADEAVALRGLLRSVV